MKYIKSKEDIRIIKHRLIDGKTYYTENGEERFCFNGIMITDHTGAPVQIEKFEGKLYEGEDLDFSEFNKVIDRQGFKVQPGIPDYVITHCRDNGSIELTERDFIEYVHLLNDYIFGKCEAPAAPDIPKPEYWNANIGGELAAVKNSGGEFIVTDINGNNTVMFDKQHLCDLILKIAKNMYD